jgi:hypothetical protein
MRVRDLQAASCKQMMLMILMTRNRDSQCKDYLAYSAQMRNHSPYSTGCSPETTSAGAARTLAPRASTPRYPLQPAFRRPVR